MTRKDFFKIIIIFPVTIALLIILSNLSYAQEIPLTGFIFDQTKTRMGREFYDTFAMLWEYPSGTEEVNITISEVSDARWGTQIFIYVEERLVYATLLKPRLEDIEGKVEEAINALLNYFFWLSEQERLLQEERKFL